MPFDSGSCVQRQELFYPRVITGRILALSPETKSGTPQLSEQADLKAASIGLRHAGIRCST